MNQAEKELRQQQFDCFKANYEYYDLTPSKEKYRRLNVMFQVKLMLNSCKEFSII